MMRIINLVIIISVIFLSFAQASVPATDRRSEDEQLILKSYYDEGIIYSLPRLGFKVMVDVEQTVRIPGPYADYAEQYLGIKEPVRNKETLWKIIGVKVELFSEPDPNAVFETNDSLVQSVSLLSSGIIKGVNVEGTESVLELNSVENIMNENGDEYVFIDLSSDNFYDILVNSDTGAEDFQTKTKQVKAREAADYLMRLRQKRAYTILDPSDVVPEDGVGFNVLVEEIKRIENDYVALFAGKKITENHQMCFRFVSGNNEVRNEVLFRFSETGGIVSPSDVSGKPVFINVEKDEIDDRKLAELKDSKHPDAGKSGLYYRVPVNASMSITDGLSSFFEGSVPMPQFGAIVPFPVNMLYDNTQIEYNTQTGTIKSINN